MGFGILPSFKSERRAIGGIMRSINNIWDHLNVEVKHHDTSTNTSLSTTPTFYELTDIDVGITGSGTGAIDKGYRTGDKIRVRTMQVKGFVGSAYTNTAHVNLLLIKHYENFSGVGVLYSDIFDVNTGSTPLGLSTQLRRNEQKKQYKILQRRVFKLEGTEETNKDMSFNMYFKNKKRAGSFVEWEGADGQDLSNGKYYLVAWISDGNNAASFQFSTRVTYVDN